MKRILLPFLVASAQASEPLLIADFETGTYSPWTVEGDAFGLRPAAGKLGGQQGVSGFAGKGLVNSFHNSDNGTGRLTSPAFKVQRKFITFLIGGGGWAGETCMNLLVGGKVVRTAARPNVNPGGSEQLRGAAWDVAEFVGRDASIVIVDSRKGGWGHINVDQIVQADDKGSAPLASVAPKPAPELTREVTIDAAFLQLPLVHRKSKDETGVEKLTLEADGKVLRFMRLKFSEPGREPDFWYSVDVREFKGRKVTLRYKSHDKEALARLKLEDKEIIDPKAYAGSHRPRFHFSPRIGWMNDVNGTYYLNGLYHLFYQANPTTTAWSTGFDMHWGHSVSRDLVHWEEWPIALFPDHTGNCFSGASIVVKQRIPGLLEKVPAPAMFFSATTPFSQHVATTRDGGRTWQRFAGNPVVPNISQGDRDPKVVWHEESQTYVMVLFVEKEGRRYLILNSKDLMKWEVVSELPGWYECPEFFPVKSPTTGESLWLLYGSYSTPKDAPQPFTERSAYMLGKFDGRTFTPIGPTRHAHLGPNFYAALIFDNEPTGRPVMMGWTSGTSFPGEPFNQCASVPLHLNLKPIADRDTLTFEPAAELEALRGGPIADPSRLAKEDALDIVVRFKAATPVKVAIRAHEFVFDPATGKLALLRGGKEIAQRTIRPGGPLTARFLIDRGLIESFWNGGEAAFCAASLHTDAGPAFEIEDKTAVEALTAWPLKNIWESPSR